MICALVAALMLCSVVEEAQLTLTFGVRLPPPKATEAE